MKSVRLGLSQTRTRGRGETMWLKLDLSGINLSMQIKNYRKTSEEDWLSVWCKTDFSFVADKWLNYCEDDSEVFLAREIEDLAKSLDDLLNDRLTAPTEFNCIEPDFNFILNPKKDLRLDPKVLYVRPGCEIVDIDMEWKISFWHDGLTANYLSVTLNRTDIESLLLYLRLVMGEVRESSPEIKALISKGVISS